MADISGLSSVLVQSRSRRAERSVAVAASDSDGSPPGCLSLGSTGQVVIHVYDRRSNATEFIFLGARPRRSRQELIPLMIIRASRDLSFEFDNVRQVTFSFALLLLHSRRVQTSLKPVAAARR